MPAKHDHMRVFPELWQNMGIGGSMNTTSFHLVPVATPRAAGFFGRLFANAYIGLKDLFLRVRQG
jgi:hypothetical protein